jgi:uncharacterized protein (DUF924 family)
MKNTNDTYIKLIINFWFDKKYRSINHNKWFRQGKKLDNDIKKTFSYILSQAEKGKLQHWLQTKNGFLAYIILLDQFSRHIYRNSGKSYQNDALCLQSVKKYLFCYLDQYTPVESLFVLMPFQHSENICDQKMGVTLLTHLLETEKTKSGKKVYQEALHHQVQHLKIIEQFRRFPKRNSYLGRESTPSEIYYIQKSDPNLPY